MHLEMAYGEPEVKNKIQLLGGSCNLSVGQCTVTVGPRIFVSMQGGT